MHLLAPAGVATKWWGCEKALIGSSKKEQKKNGLEIWCIGSRGHPFSFTPPPPPGEKGAVYYTSTPVNRNLGLMHR